MANQLGKFSANLSTTTHPLGDLLVKENLLWRERQQRVSNAVKTDLTITPELVLYDPLRATIVSENASSFGQVVVLL